MAHHFLSGGARLHYEDDGAGEPIVLLHGNGENLHIFDAMRASLAARYRLLLPDTRGHGQSERGEGPLDFAVLAADAAALIAHAGLTRAHILGFSDGGNTALHLGWMYPDLVASLTVIGANMTPGGIKASCQRPIVFGHALCSAVALIDKRAVLKRDILRLMVRHPQLTLEQLRRISAPALVLAGEHDIVKEDETRRIADAIPDSRLFIVPGAGHALPMKHPDIVLSHVLTFLESI